MTPASHYRSGGRVFNEKMNRITQMTVLDCLESQNYVMNSGNVVKHFLILDAYTAYPFVASAAVLIASFLKVTQWQGLDPSSLWGTAPLANAPPLGLCCCSAGSQSRVTSGAFLPSPPPSPFGKLN